VIAVKSQCITQSRLGLLVAADIMEQSIHVATVRQELNTGHTSSLLPYTRKFKLNVSQRRGEAIGIGGHLP
jgi:hypothetical protein